jgi:hypothetical protein
MPRRIFGGADRPALLFRDAGNLKCFVNWIR